MGPLRHSLIVHALVIAAVAGAPAGATYARTVLPSGPEEPLAEGDAIPGGEPRAAAPAPDPVAAATRAAPTPAIARPGPGAQSAADAAREARPAPPPAEVPAAPAAPPARTRKVELELPLELEVHGRFLMDVSADERDAWGRTLGISSARLGFEARLPGVKTVLEADLASNPVIVDAFVRLDGPGATRLTAGRFKTPFSERRLESAWSLPVVDRGLVDRYVVKQNGLGGRRVGLAGTLRPWEGRLEATGGVFLGDKDALEGATDAGEDWAGRVAVKRWRALEVGASGYRAGGGGAPGAAPSRWAAGPFANLALGPLRAAVEGFTGRGTDGPFAAGTALVSWRLGGGEGRLRLTPVAGAEAVQLRGATAGIGYGAIAGAVISRAERLKVKVQGEWARKPGDVSPAAAVAIEVGSRF